MLDEVQHEAKCLAWNQGCPTVPDHFNGSGHNKKHLRKLAHVELAILRLRLRRGDVLRRTTASMELFWGTNFDPVSSIICTGGSQRKLMNILFSNH